MQKTTEDKLRVLSSIAARLNEKNITWAVGASALLYFNKIVGEFNDLDLMVDDKDALAAKEILLTMGTLHHSDPNRRYRTKHFFEYTIDGVEVDLIGGFVILREDVEQDCSLHADEIAAKVQVNGQTIPLHSVPVWRSYYEWMGRGEKVKLIDSAAPKA